MRKIFTFLALFLLTGISLYAQVGINANDLTPDPSAMLDVSSTSKGFLPPRMTTEQMNAISTPAVGLIVYNITVNSLFWFNGTSWMRFNDPYMETDPIFSAHAASGITVGNIGNWNTAYGWGNHALAGYLTSYMEIDPVFGTHPASGITAGNIGDWNTAYTNRITGASGTSPLNLSISGNLLSGSINTANSSTSGYLTSTDWNTFNNKQNALTLGNATSGDITITGGNSAIVGNGMTMTVNKGNLTSSDITISAGSGSVLGSGTSLSINKGSLTEATSSVLNISGGTGSVLGSGVTVQVKQSGTSQSGYLSNTDWNTFNNKQNTLTFGNLTSSDITVSGGTGAVKGAGAGLTINKGSLTESGSSVLTITGGNAAVLGTGATIEVKQAGTSQSGYLSSGDWNSFNNKVSSQWTSDGQNISYNTGKVGVGTSSPVQSALAEFTSTTTGVLLPRMTRIQRNAIASPADGLMVYCTNCGINGSLSIYTNGSWMTFSPCIIAAPLTGVHVLMDEQIKWNWIAVPGASGYKWNTIADYESASDMAANTTYTETGTVCGNVYNRFIWAYSACGESEMTTLTATDGTPAAPTVTTHIPSQTSIVWNWNAVLNATGYKWNTTNDYTSAIDMTSTTTKAETGLICGTSYTRYIWAYNGCGYSLPALLIQSTPVCITCGGSVTINHLVAGGVAPIDKLVTYGTAINIPGEPSKCWITKNLGASQQATIASDTSEASAGWYWQFNRKQGWQFTNTLTPNITWDATNDNTSVTWEVLKDPCAIELGTDWRVPTKTEWTNVDNYWSNWNNTFASVLKVHAAGYLNGAGNIANRGIYGYYWSSTQNDVPSSWCLFLANIYSFMDYTSKSGGFPIRCVRNY